MGRFVVGAPYRPAISSGQKRVLTLFTPILLYPGCLLFYNSEQREQEK